MDETILGLISITIIVTIIVILHLLKRRVLVHSLVIKELITINNSTKYKTVEPSLFFCYDCLSRAEFNHFSLENYFLERVIDDIDYFKKIITSLEFNKCAFEKYKKSISNIDIFASKDIAFQLKIPFVVFNFFEKYYLKKFEYKAPLTNISILCSKEYTSPAGRTHIWSDVTYNLSDLKNFLKRANEIETQRELRTYHIERERSLMSNSLRYDILKRDGFRCQICGSTVEDGVKLHVDHIVPVSKGGHTVYDNLRTLCDRCNSGKSDKIE